MIAAKRLSYYVLVASLIFLAIAGCRPASDGQSAPTNTSAAVGAIDREAPRGQAELEQWAIGEIQTVRPAVPLPEKPELATSAQPCHRLGQMLNGADIRCSWKSADADAKPLLSLGPFRSDRPSPVFTVEKAFDRQLGWGLLMSLAGFRIEAEKVGRVSIRLRAPAGKYLDLRWSEGGFARLPIPDNRQTWPLELDMHGMTDWEGPIEQILFRVSEAPSEGAYEFESIQFWGHENEFPKPVAVRPYSVDERRLYALYTHAPAEIRIPHFLIPTDGKFTAGLAAVIPPEAAERGAGASAEARFRLSLDCEGATLSVLDEKIPAGEAWRDVAVSLAEWAGRKVTLVLTYECDDPRVVGLWGDPTVYQPVSDPPIMILYLIDAFAAKHSSLYGYARPTTPTMEKLAADGVWFRNMYANSPVTISSVPNTQLSMSAERHGVFHASIKAPLELVTIADALSAAGFATASFITNANAGARQNMDQGFDEYFPHGLFHWEERTSADRSVPIEDAADWLKRHADRPAFMYIHTCEPHAPYTPPPGYLGRFDSDYRGFIDGTLNEKHGFFAAKTPEDIEYVRALYDEECLFADAQLGRFLERLDADGYGPRMNLFVIADHGEELQEHGHWGHGEDLYDETLRVPLIAHGPLVTARGRQDVPAQLYDIMPTILDLFGAPQPYPLAGTSLRTLLQKDAGSPPAELSPDRTLFVSHHRYRGQGQIEYAVVEANRWKLHYRYMLDDEPAYPTPARFELYDLQADPEEKKNLINQERDVARRLMCKLVDYARRQSPYQSKQTGLLFDTQQLHNLQAQGYIPDEEEATSRPAMQPPKP